MTERPILFSGALVRAILEGHKTQTRRPLKSVPGLETVTDALRNPDGTWALGQVVHGGYGYTVHPGLPCPFGAPGDRLWVRETWGLAFPSSVDDRYVDEWCDWRKPLPEKCPTGWHVLYGEDWTSDSASNAEERGFRWRPSIHMPRWASRINLEVTEVRAERLQAITEEDARAEGFRTHWPIEQPELNLSAREMFREAWDAIYAAAPWRQDPWVWVVSFRRLP